MGSMYCSDWCLGQRNWFYSIGVFCGVVGGPFCGVVSCGEVVGEGAHLSYLLRDMHSVNNQSDLYNTTISGL